MNRVILVTGILTLWFTDVVVPYSRAQNNSATTNQPVVCHHEIRHNPNFSIHWVRLELANTNIHVHVAKAGDVPTNSGHWVTTLLPSSEIAARENFDVTINGDFFNAQDTVDVEGKKTGYVRGKLSEPVGPAMTEGKVWHQPVNPRPCLEITSSNTARIYNFLPSEPLDKEAREIIGGGQIIVGNGKMLTGNKSFFSIRHPRTAVGIDKTGTRLLLWEVDGRQPNLSIGMTLSEVATEMIRLGCDTALNLDGGGSSTFVWRDEKTRKLKIVNSPSDTHERSVVDVLGATIKLPLLETETSD